MSSGQEIWIVAIFFWVACGIIAAGIASQKKAGITGFFLGLFFGPLGVLGACFLDERERCPHCRHRVDDGVRICGVCRQPINWASSVGWSESTSAFADTTREEEMRQEREYRRRLQQHAEQRVRAQRDQDREALIQFCRKIRDNVVAFGVPAARRCGRFLFAPFLAVNHFLDLISDGSKSIKYAYIGLVVFLIATPLLLVRIVLGPSLESAEAAPPQEVDQRPVAVDAANGVADK
jgi:hypothetical protein